MKKSTQTGILAVMGLTFVGAATFLFTRKAVAKEKAQEAFVVDQNCGSFLVVDEDMAKAAFIAAAIAVAPSPDSNAVAALQAILAFMFPQCLWDDPPDNRTFVRGTGASIRWIDAKNLIGDRTVAELRELLEDSGELQAGAPIPWIVPMVFGTGGCMSCAMGTGGQVGTGYGPGDQFWTYANASPSWWHPDNYSSGYDLWGAVIDIQWQCDLYAVNCSPYHDSEDISASTYPIRVRQNGMKNGKWYTCTWEPAYPGWSLVSCVFVSSGGGAKQYNKAGGGYYQETSDAPKIPPLKKVGTGVIVYGQTYEGPYAHYVNAYRSGVPVYSVEQTPTGWLTATYLPVKPKGVHRRWIQLNSPIHSGSPYRNAILFTQWGAAQRFVIALIRMNANGKVAVPLQAKVMPEGWSPPAQPPGTGGCGGPPAGVHQQFGLPGTGGPQHLKRKRR